jgi:hypothetical protein
VEDSAAEDDVDAQARHPQAPNGGCRHRDDLVRLPVDDSAGDLVAGAGGGEDHRCELDQP